MKKISVVVYLIFFFSLVSCDTRIEDNRRILITGTIQGVNGEALNDINVISGDEFTQLGAGKSDENGKFNLTSLSLANGILNDDGEFEPRRIDEIFVNAQVVDDGFGLTSSDNNYSYVNIVNNDIFDGVKVDLGIIILQELAQLEINFIKEEYIDQELKAFINYKSSSCRIELPDAIAVEQIGCDTENFLTNLTLFAQNNERNININSLLNENVNIEVLDNNGNVIFNQDFTINESNASINIQV